MAIGSPAELTSSLSVTELLAPFRSDPAGTGGYSDVDGPLAAIVDDPAAARPLPGVIDALTQLARHYGRVGVISGRPAAYLRDHLGERGLFLSGQYGLELVVGGEVQAIPEAEPWRAVVEETAAAAEVAGLIVERKGVSVTLHYRSDPSQEQAARVWTADRAQATGLALHPARMSFELRPPVERDKGTVLATAAEGCRQVCFLGDDRGDLEAFDTLDRMAAAGATVLKVGVRSPEAPQEVLERADLVVDGPEGSLTVLRGLLGGREDR